MKTAGEPGAERESPKYKKEDQESFGKVSLDISGEPVFPKISFIKKIVSRTVCQPAILLIAQGLNWNKYGIKT